MLREGWPDCLGWRAVRHHEETIDRFTASESARPEVLGVVVVGSVARGDERPDSDVDVYVVVTDQAYAEAGRAGRIAYVSYDGVTYDGGYVDVKLSSPRYLAEAIERADDPTRASFLGGRVSLDRLGDLAVLVEAITVLPENVWERRVHAYRSQVALYGGYFLPQADERGDRFLVQHAAVHTAFAAGRAALAAEHRLFRGQKYLTKDLTGLAGLPAGFLPAWHALLTEPTPDSAATMIEACDALAGGSPLDVDESLSTFIADNELAWLHHTIPPEFW
jgi:predicted nucleotidyltransferase